MNHSIIWSERSKKDLAGIDKKIQERIVAKVESIKKDPFLHVKRLTGVPLYSLRVGDYRVILDIKKQQILIFVTRVGHRGKIYTEI